MSRRVRLGALGALMVVAVGGLGVLGGAGSAAASTAAPASPGSAMNRVVAASGSGTVTRAQAIVQLQKVRASIDETLSLFKQGRDADALAQSESGYLNHFEYVEVPLRVAAPEFTLNAEATFAEVRTLIRDHASTSSVRAKIVDLRGIVDAAERTLSSPGLTAPALVAGESFLIIFREGLEAVLLLSVLLGYLEATKASQYRKPVLYGVGLAVLATIATVFALQLVFALAPVGREMMEAITAIVAVAVLFWVSFWLVSRLEHRKWMEFLKARVFTAVSLGSATSLMLIGFTAVYREGFETVLFYQALFSFGPGLGTWIAVGFGAGVVALVVCSWAIFRLGRRLPIKAFLSIAVAFIMATSVAFLGNAIAALQEADVLGYHALAGWPRLPIFVAEATGYRPSVETVVAQAALTAVYLLGALVMFVVRPALARRRGLRVPRRGTDAPVASTPGPETPVASTPGLGASGTPAPSVASGAAIGRSSAGPSVASAGTDPAGLHA